MMIIQQPAVYVQPMPVNPWTTGLFDCCDDIGICCCGCFCPPCLFGYNSQALAGRDCSGACCLYCLFCCCGCCCDDCFGDFMTDYLGARVRQQIRMKYGLMEDPCSDFLVHSCCAQAALCQEARELKVRGASNARYVPPQQCQQHHQQAAMYPPQQQAQPQYVPQPHYNPEQPQYQQQPQYAPQYAPSQQYAAQPYPPQYPPQY